MRILRHGENVVFECECGCRFTEVERLCSKDAESTRYMLYCPECMRRCFSERHFDVNKSSVFDNLIEQDNQFLKMNLQSIKDNVDSAISNNQGRNTVEIKANKNTLYRVSSTIDSAIRVISHCKEDEK